MSAAVINVIVETWDMQKGGVASAGQAVVVRKLRAASMERRGQGGAQHQLDRRSAL